MMVEGQTQVEAEKESRNLRRTNEGVVIADSRNKTIKVGVKYLSKHQRYGKYLRKQIVLHVHDEKNEAKIGDTVEIMECRPISKTKSWRLVKVIKRAEV
jgi:small subunit ribosomal protein S17